MTQMQTSANLGFSITNIKTYLFAAVFVLGNLVLPQICHLIPQGGLIFLPIYFFTLIGAYRFGRNVGMMSAIFSPLMNCLLFGMPPVAALPAIMFKSTALALIASYVASRSQKVTLPLIALTVVGYQLVGMSFEFVQGLMDSMGAATAAYHAIQDVRIGFPGLLVQILCGYAIVKKLDKIEL